MDRIESLFEKAKPLLGDRKAKALWLAYTSETDLAKRREIEGFLHGLLVRKLDESFQKGKILLDVPPSLDHQRGYPLGTVISGDKEIGSFFISDEQLNQHMGIWGMTGSGKTNIIHLLLSNLLQTEKNFLVFDWKRNFRDLLEQYPGKLKVYTVGRNVSPFYWNPLIPPPATDPAVWLKQFIEVCQHALFLGHGVESILQKIFDQLYEMHGVYSGTSEGYPTLKDAQEMLQSYRAKGREAQWLDSTKRAIGALCFGGIGRALNVQENHKLDLSQNAVFELDGLTDSEKTFFTEAILLWLFHQRLSEREREKFRHCVVIEEAHHILFRAKQTISGKETIMDIILRQIRELGEGFVAIDQQPSLITPTALANIHTHVGMKMFYPDDVNLTSKLINLPAENSDYLRMLQTGWGIVKIPDWHRPFLVKFDLFPIQKGLITDEKLDWGFYDTDSVESGYEKLHRKFQQVISEVRGLDKKELPQDQKTELTDAELALLTDISKFSFSGVTERYHRLNLNAFRGNELKSGLTQGGFLKEQKLSNLKGQLKVLVLTDRGKDKLRAKGIEPKEFPQNASLEHEFWKAKVKELLKSKGYAVEEEVLLNNGHRVDLVAKKDGSPTAFEVETGKSDAVNNLQMDLQAGFRKVVCLVLVGEHADKLLHELPQLEGDQPGRARLITLRRFLSDSSRLASEADLAFKGGHV